MIGTFRKLWRWINGLKLFPLSCNGKLCPWPLNYVHMTCLSCRPRRRWRGKFVDPPFWIQYTYKAFFRTRIVKSYASEGKIFSRRDGEPFKLTTYETLLIDPRGRFTSLRVTAIRVLDSIMTVLKVGRPIVEVCEFLANYP